MGYLSKGYYTICLSAILSSVLFVILIVFFFETEFEQIIFLGMNFSIVSIQACGIVLCAIGYRKHETVEPLFRRKKEDSHSSNLRLNLPLTAFLFMWGGFIVFLTSYYVFFSTPYEKLMLMRKTVQFAAYVAWALKGTIGIISGLIFTAKSLLWQPKTETSMNR